MEQHKNEVMPGRLNLMALNSITGAGMKQHAAEEDNWLQITEIMSRTLKPFRGSL